MDTSPSLIGRTLAGRFRILRCIGKGGMAAVFAAVQDEGEPRDVAIKVMKQELMRDRTVLRRFQREAKAASKLEHENTIRVIAFGVDGQDAYIAMELAKGKDLLQALAEQRPMHQYRAVNVVAQVCAALSAAHALGIVHRDLKPENIMLVPNPEAPFGETVKVLDFGIAKILDLPDKPAGDVDAGPSTITKSALTRVGTIVGTPAYMSPEQCRGGEIDGRSDLYACGVLLYQLCTGQVPFLGETPLHTAMRHIHAPPRPPTELRPDLHPQLEGIILKALEKWPANRPQTAEALRAELAEVLPQLPDYPGESASASPSLPPRAMTSDPTQLAIVASDAASSRSKVIDDHAPTPIEPSETDPTAQRVPDEDEPRTKLRDTVPPVAKLGAPLKAQLKYQDVAAARDNDEDDDDVRTSVKSPEAVLDAVTRPNTARPSAAAGVPRPAGRTAAPTLTSGSGPPRPARTAPPTLSSAVTSEVATAPRRGRGPLNSTAVMEPDASVAPAGPAAAPPTPPPEDDDDERPTALRAPNEVADLLAANRARGMSGLGAGQPSIVDGPVIQIDAAARPPGARGTVRMRRDGTGAASPSEEIDAGPTPKKPPAADDVLPPPSGSPLEVSLSELQNPDLGAPRPSTPKATLVSAGSASAKMSPRTQPMTAVQQTVKMAAGDHRGLSAQRPRSAVERTLRNIIEELPGTTGVLLGVGIGVLASVVFAVVIAVLSR